MGAIFSLSEKRVFAVAVNHDGFYRILRASVNVKMKAKCANQIQKVHKRRADMAGVTHKGIIGGFPSRGLLTRTFPPFHELKCAWVRHPDGEQEFGAAGYRGVLTSEKGGKVQLDYLFSSTRNCGSMLNLRYPYGLSLKFMKSWYKESLEGCTLS